MASIYRKKNSPYWFIQFIDGDGKRRNKSTEFRASDPGETMKARTLRTQMEAKELSRTGTVGPLGGNWDAWVPQFLDRHCDNPRTRERYADGWKRIALWLQVRKLHSPRDITYRNALEYIDWRTAYKKKSGKTVGRNTAIFELKKMSMIIGEGVRLGHTEASPLVSLKLRKDKAAKKPELSDGEIVAIKTALAEEPEWMQTAFEIALHIGCRLRETRIPLSCVDFTENKITFPSPKGGEDRAFSIPMPTALRPCWKGLPRQRRSSPWNFRSSLHGGGSNSSSRLRCSTFASTACA